MVDQGTIRDWTHGPRVGNQLRNGRHAIRIHFTEQLYKQIMAEATKREWSFSHMVRHLCEASIDGIE